MAGREEIGHPERHVACDIPHMWGPDDLLHDNLLFRRVVVDIVLRVRRISVGDKGDKESEGKKVDEGSGRA